jgi:hypothetical protein
MNAKQIGSQTNFISHQYCFSDGIGDSEFTIRPEYAANLGRLTYGMYLLHAMMITVKLNNHVMHHVRKLPGHQALTH